MNASRRKAGIRDEARAGLRERARPGFSPLCNPTCDADSGKRMNPVQVRQEICSGCRACEIACVFRREDVFGTASARIHVAKNEAEGEDIPRLCRLCLKPACVSACPTGALSQNESTGIIVLSDSDCSGCLSCREACPYGSIFVHPLSGLPLICDLCSGDPACVKRCSLGAIQWER